MYRYKQSEWALVALFALGLIMGAGFGLVISVGLAPKTQHPSYQTINDLADCLKNENLATCQIEQDGNEYEVIGTPKKGE